MNSDASQIEFLIADLPNAADAERFFARLQLQHPKEAKNLLRPENRGLLSDVLAIAAWSGFLAVTIENHPAYLVWLGRRRSDSEVYTREDLLESLARFSATNSQLEPHVLLSRFRRRELLRIYLRDIRNLTKIAEITEELSNLADAILAYALKIAGQELENRFGIPLAADERGRTTAAEFSIVALGKLGSRELNYASDIDLLFLYSGTGATSETGTRGAISNKEFFVKLAEQITRIVGQMSGEGAAYRVDLRLRPHGRVGALAISVDEAVNYYQTAARDWERQVLLRSRSAAGDAEVFKKFAAAVEPFVFQKDVSVRSALENVHLSKTKINQEHERENGFNVKLGKGGIREIEFIAQALQLAFGGRDEWLRVSHTLIALGRLADRQYVTKGDLIVLTNAYNFLRTLEHRLQMENGLQTHAVPENAVARELIAKRMNFADTKIFDETLRLQTAAVSRIFERVFGSAENPGSVVEAVSKNSENRSRQNFQQRDFSARSIENQAANHDETAANNLLANVLASLEKSNAPVNLAATEIAALRKFCEVSPYFCEILGTNPSLVKTVSALDTDSPPPDYQAALSASVENAAGFGAELANLRTAWSKFYVEIAAQDIFEQIAMREANRRQTALAEAGISAALKIVERELKRRFDDSAAFDAASSLAILGLGRLGGRGMDYGSDLDLVLIYNDGVESPFIKLSNAELYARAAEILVTALSSQTREGHLYRVDLRLRPDGKNGATANGATAFLHYLSDRAAIWEWLAYVKLRAIGASDFAAETENAARRIVHDKAKNASAAELKTETKRVRNALETQKARELRRGEVDIKHGAGGLLDVYFAVRYLQLRDDIFDENADRTTTFTLEKLRQAESLSAEQFEILRDGYNFLRRLDHNLRLTAGRSTRLPALGSPLLAHLAQRLKFDSPTELLETLALHTASIRQIFDSLLDQ